MNGSTKEAFKYSSCGCIYCDIYKSNGFIMYEINDIMEAICIPKLNHYHNYDSTQLSNNYLQIKFNVINRIKWNIIKNNKQYVLINLLYALLVYEQIWLITSIFFVFIIINKIFDMALDIGVLFDYYHKQNINYKMFLCVFIGTIKCIISIVLSLVYDNKNFILNNMVGPINSDAPR